MKKDINIIIDRSIGLVRSLNTMKDELDTIDFRMYEYDMEDDHPVYAKLRDERKQLLKSITDARSELLRLDDERKELYEKMI